MSHIRLRCSQCGAPHKADMSTLKCGSCGAPLDVEYLEGQGRLPGDNRDIPLPFHAPQPGVSLGEGQTPCVPLPALGHLLGLDRLYGKLEFLNPTGSFKDRGTAVMLAVAREHGVAEIVEDSSGNAGASVAAYAARAGIKAHIFAPASAPQAKVQQIRVYGAEAHAVEGSREATTRAAIDFCTRQKLVYASHNLSPYFIEGTKTFAYEVCQQFPDALPEHIVVPVGNGSLFIGAWKGFCEMARAGRIALLPRMHCVQAEAVMPIVAAWQGKRWTAQPGARTIAGGISVGAPPRKEQVLGVLRDSRGVAVAVPDEDILRWQRLLAEKEGVYAEPTSAAAFAGLERLVREGHVQRAEVVLVPITGFGLKDAPPVR